MVFAESLNTDNILPILETGVSIEQAKSNTLIFLGAMSLFLLLLVAFGYLKNNRKKSVSRVIAIVLPSLIFVKPVNAFCPVCTIAVGAGIGLSKTLGIDDTITSMWIGAVIVSSIFWLLSFLKKKNVKAPFFTLFLIILTYIITYLALKDSINLKGNTLFGIDKIILGFITGTVVFLIGHFLHLKLKRDNNNEVFFPFQKVVIPIGFLIITSLLVFFILYF